MPPAVLGGLGVAAGVVIALLAVKFAMPAPQATSTGSANADAELTLQRELVSEIRALRAARQEPTPTESSQVDPQSTGAAKVPSTRADPALATKPRAKKEASQERARVSAADAREPRQPSETTAELTGSPGAPGDDLFQGIR